MKSLSLACLLAVTLLHAAAQTENHSGASIITMKGEKVDCSSLVKPGWNANQRGAAQVDCEFYNISIEKGGDAWGEFAANDATLARGKGKEEVSHERYVTVWQKQDDGSWRFVWEGGEADPQK